MSEIRQKSKTISSSINFSNSDRVGQPVTFINKKNYIYNVSDINWIVGFIEGEGHFGLSIDFRPKNSTEKRRRYRNGVLVDTRFSLGLHKREKETMTFIQNYLISKEIKSHIRPRGEKQLCLTVEGRVQCLKLVEIMAPIKWHSAKRKDFDLWTKIIFLLIKNEWDTKRKLLKIFEISDQMNRYGEKQSVHKKYTKQFFENLWADDELDNNLTCKICGRILHPPKKQYCELCYDKYRKEYAVEWQRKKRRKKGISRSGATEEWILERIKQKKKTTCRDLLENMYKKVTMEAIRYHVSRLKKKDLITSRREGKCVYLVFAGEKKNERKK